MPELTPRVEVVIPTWNRRDLLQSCLRSLEGQTYREFRAVVVDNGSTDRTGEMVRERFPGARLVALPANRGFAGAVNDGIRSSPSELIALLNNDAEAEPGWLSALVEALDSHPGFAAAASKVLRRHPPGSLDSAGDGLGPLLIPYPFGAGEPDEGQYDETRPVFAACGAAALYRRSAFDLAGLLDDDFFAYLEDFDFAFRAHLHGLGCLYVPAARVLHAGAQSSGGRLSSRVVFLSTRNLLWLLARNLPAPLLWRWLPRIALGQAFWFRELAVRKGQAWPWLKGFAAGLLSAPRQRRRGRPARAAARARRGDLAASLRQAMAEVERAIQRRRERLAAGGGRPEAAGQEAS